jgi:hypothetical protein
VTVRLLPARHGVRAEGSPRHDVDLLPLRHDVAALERHAVRQVNRSSLFVAPEPAWLLLLLGGN